MLNDRINQRSQRLPEFLIEAETLLAKSEECLAHLQLISNDQDAINCMLDTLLTLANRADALALGAVSSFARSIHTVLSRTHQQIDLQHKALLALKECFTLMAWQLELVDINTGKLGLDDAEQACLLEAFIEEIGRTPLRFPVPARDYACPSLPARHA